VEVSTDKVGIEIPADISGYLSAIKVPAGTTVPIGSTIAVIAPPATFAP
jgi:pyruvate/2-oxoglutarate dehydrogenase complex dihydrolipoamide acyltransferase (E2) component